MIRWVPYIFPMLINYVLGGVFFITPLRCSMADAPGWIVGATMSVWALCYTIVSFFVGKIVTTSNAYKLIIAAGIGISVSSLGFLIFTGIYTQFIWIACVGISSAVYCTSFQLFAKSIESDQSSGVKRAAGLYTASWSIGMATGPFIFGILPISASFTINIVIGLLIAAGIYIIAKSSDPQVSVQADNAQSTPEKAEKTPQDARYPDLVIVGWVTGGIGTVAIFVLRTLVPYRSNLIELSKTDAGIIMATVSYVQAAAALLLLTGRSFMYKIFPAVSATVCGIVSLLLFGFSGNFPLFLAAAVLFGIYSGYFYFMFVYHSLISPEKSTKYVAGNEIIVGATGAVGPFVGGLLTSPETSGTAFAAAAALSAASVIFCSYYLRRAKCKRRS